MVGLYVSYNNLQKMMLLELCFACKYFRKCVQAVT